MGIGISLSAVRSEMWGEEGWGEGDWADKSKDNGWDKGGQEVHHTGIAII